MWKERARGKQKENESDYLKGKTIYDLVFSQISKHSEKVPLKILTTKRNIDTLSDIKCSQIIT